MKLWISQILSQIAIYVATFILINKIFLLTKSAIAVSFLWLFWMLPSILIAPIVGFFIDIWNNRKILVITNAIQALIIFSYFFVSVRSYHFIYFLVFVYSLVNQFYVPTEISSVPWLVAKDSLPSANSFFVLTSQISFILGFGLAGLLVKNFGEMTTIIGLSILLIIASISTVFLPDEKKNKPMDNFLNFISKEVQEGWKFITKKQILVLFALGLMGLFQLITVTLSIVLPKISEEILTTNFTDVATYLILAIVFGLATGSYLFTQKGRYRRKNKWIVNGFFTLAICMISIFAQSLLPQTFKLYFLVVMLFIGGLAAALVIVPAQTFVQEVTPVSIRGKIFGLVGAIITLSTIPPVIFVAGIVEAIGVIKFIGLTGILLLVFAIYFLKHSDAIIIFSTNHRS